MASFKFLFAFVNNVCMSEKPSIYMYIKINDFYVVFACISELSLFFQIVVFSNKLL